MISVLCLNVQNLFTELLPLQVQGEGYFLAYYFFHSLKESNHERSLWDIHISVLVILFQTLYDNVL